MPKSWHHFSAKEHAAFLVENGFSYRKTNGSHDYYHRRVGTEDYIVQVVQGKEKKRQSRKTMDMSARHSGIPKSKYEEWINS